MSVGNPVSPPQAMASTTPLGGSNINSNSNQVGQNSAAASISSPLGSPTGAQAFNIRSLIAQKERELHDINDYRVSTLEEELETGKKVRVN